MKNFGIAFRGRRGYYATIEHSGESYVVAIATGSYTSEKKIKNSRLRDPSKSTEYGYVEVSILSPKNNALIESASKTFWRIRGDMNSKDHETVNKAKQKLAQFMKKTVGVADDSIYNYG